MLDILIHCQNNFESNVYDKNADTKNEPLEVLNYDCKQHIYSERETKSKVVIKNLLKRVIYIFLK